MSEEDPRLQQFKELCKRRRDSLSYALTKVRRRIDRGRFLLADEWRHCKVESHLQDLEDLLRDLFTRFQYAEPTSPQQLSEWIRFVNVIGEPMSLSWRGLYLYCSETPELPVGVSETSSEELQADIDLKKSEHFHRVRKAMRNLVLAHWHFCQAAGSLSEPTREILEDAPSLLKQAIDNLIWLTEVFVSYSRKDRPILDEILKRVDEPLRKRECIGLWFDKREHEDGVVGSPGISGGVRWKSELDEKLHTLDCALALLSPSFSSSKVIQEFERRVLIERFDRKQLWLLPVRVSESKCERHLQHIDWFPSDVRLLERSENGALAPEMLERCERELTAKILMAMAEASDAGAEFRFLKDRLQKERLRDSPTS